MGIAPIESRQWVAIALCGALAGLGLSGCSSISEKFAETIADAPVVGLPAGTPERPKAPAAYPAVHDMPPPRGAVLSGPEQMKMEEELMTARNRQQTLVGQAVTPPPASYAPAAPKKPEPATIAASKKAKPAAKAARKPAQPSAPVAPNSSASIY